MMIRRGAYAMDPQLHGFSAGQVNVSIDGMRMFGACTDRMDPVTSYLEPDNLSSLTIVHGTGGNAFGNTVGGSFNMMLKEPVLGKENIAFSAGTGYETVSNGSNSRASLEIGKEKWALRSSGTYRKHDSYRSGDGEIVPFSQFRKVNFHTSVKYAADENNILRFDFLLDDAYDVGYTALPMDVGEARARMYALEYSRPSGEIIKNLKARLYYNSVFHLMDDSQRDSTFILDGGVPGTPDTVYMRMDMPGWSNTLGFYLNWEADLGARSKFFFKVDDYLNFSRADMTMYMNSVSNPGEPPMYAETWPEQYRNVAGVFGRYTMQIENNWKLDLNARIDHSVTRVISETGWRQFEIFGYDIDRYYQEMPVSINSSIAWRPWKGIGWQAGVGYSERLPTNSEQFGFFLFNALDGYDYLGNPDIAKEGSAEIWTKFRFSKPGFRASIDARYSHVNNYILGISDPGIPPMNLYAAGLKSYQNIDHARIFGMGLQIQWMPVRPLSVYSITKYTHGKTFSEEALPLIPPLKNISILRYQVKNFSLQAEAEFSAAQNRISKPYGEIPTQGFSVYHMRASWMLSLSALQIEFSTGVENIFNKSYSEHLDWGNYYRPGRNIYLNLNILL